MKLIIDVPQTMIDELRDGCFGVKHNIYELAGLIMNGTILEQEQKTDVLDRINGEIKEYCEKNCIDGDIVADELSLIIDKYRKEG